MLQLSPDDSSSELERLYEYYQQPIVRYLMGLVHDQEIAADLCQDTFERVLKHLSRQETNSPQTAYYFNNLIYRIAKNRAIDHDRHNKLINFLPLPESEAELSVEGDEDRILERLWLQETVPQLPQQQRESLLAKHYWGYKQNEIALKLGISESAVSANVSHGKAHLRREYFSETAVFKSAVASSAEHDIDRVLQGLFRGTVWNDWKKLGEIRLHNRQYTKEQIRVVNEERIFYRLMTDNDPPDEDGDVQITRLYSAWPNELVIIRRAKIIPMLCDFRLS